MAATVDLSGLELTIGDAARLVRRSPEWFRKAEREGKLPPARRDDAGRRVYSLEEIKAINEWRNRGRETAPVA